MKSMKKCVVTKEKISKSIKLDKRRSNKRRSSAGMFYTSSAGAVTSLILMVGLTALFSLTGILNLLNLNNSASATSAIIRVTSSGAQNVDVKPDASGATATSIGVDNVNVFSTCRSGYNFTIFTSVNDNNLYLNGSSSNNQEGKHFSPADGVGTLINSPNTWGFLVSDTVPDSGSVFQPIPTLNNPRYIKTAEETARDIDIDDDINIYYGVAISSGLSTGSYKLIQDQSTSQDGVVSYGFSMDPTCEENTITLNAGNGINTLTASGWTGSGSASISKGFHEGETIDLSTITRGYKAGYNGAKYTVTGGTGTISGSIYTVGEDDGQITISATGLNTPTCTMQGGATKVYNRSATTLTATDNASDFDTTSVDLTYSFGYASSDSADLANFTAAGTANTLSVAKNAFRGARYYGVKVVATDKTDSTITSTCTSGTGSSTGTTVANRTTMTLVNSRINFDATTNGGTLSGTSPVYVYYGGTATYSSRTGTTARAIPTATPPAGKVFDGWYTAATGGSKVINADGTVVASVASWTNASKQWIRTSTSTSATANILYAHYVNPPMPLYDLVATQSKGTQTLAQLRAAITTSNSGVYEYNTSVFGTASDAANTSKIYYYRGILDNTTGSYGSDGDNAAWPNTVLLDTTGNGKDTSDTCWRIVRTTGSGGVKMIYQGKWTGSTCANSSTKANAISSVYFNRRSSSSTNDYDTKGRILYVGYNYSTDTSLQTSTTRTVNSTLFANGTASNLRTQLESWYNSNMTAWTSKLETSAGWCNDRTTYSSTATSSKTTSNIPYKTSSATVYFGAYIRNYTTNSQPTLGCPNDTGYDLLTTSNGYIGVPSAPLTADEAAFAGSGYGSSITPYHANSYLRSGSAFWLLSPFDRGSGGNVYEFPLDSDGYLDYRSVSVALGVRPSISLTSGTTAASGTGTATDPWIVNP